MCHKWFFENISNKMFKKSEMGQNMPCRYCHLIALGETVCHEELCPKCGKVAPNRKRQEDRHLNDFLDTFYGTTDTDQNVKICKNVRFDV